MEPEKVVKSGLYTSKGREIERIAKKLGIKVRKIGKDDLERVRKANVYIILFLILIME